jgi:hypothetical protein
MAHVIHMLDGVFHKHAHTLWKQCGAGVHVRARSLIRLVSSLIWL